MKKILFILLLLTPAFAISQIKIDKVDVLESDCIANGEMAISVSGAKGSVKYYLFDSNNLCIGEKMNDSIFVGLVPGKYKVQVYDETTTASRGNILLLSEYSLLEIDVIKSGQLMERDVETGSMTVFVTGGCKFDGSHYNYRYRETDSNQEFSSWQASSVIKNVDVAKHYEVQVRDACGTIINQSLIVYGQNLKSGDLNNK